jgi:phosphomannomutase
MGSMYLNALANKINIELIRMNFELDGSFPAHQADPSQSSTLRGLQKKVVESGADFGIGTDGDGDRIVFVNEKGDIVPTSYMASLIAKQILEEKPGATIIGNVQKIFNIQRNVERLGGVFDQVRVGHTFITNRINNEPIEFCGEISGHYFFKKNGGAESSILVFLYIIKALNESGKSLSQTLLEFKRAEEKEEMNFVVPSKDSVQAILTQLESEYKDATVEKIDGVTVVTPEWRVNIRTSNTEPLLRLNVEGDSLDIVNSKYAEMSQLIEAQGGKLKTGH